MKQQEKLPELTLLDHLTELRLRIIHSVIFFLIAFIVCYSFKNEIYNLITYPLTKVLNENHLQSKIIFTKLTENFTSTLSIVLSASIFISIPYWAIELWLFITPALYKDEKQLLFMLGGHPGFKVPLYENEKYEDYYLKFEKEETVDAMQVVDNFLANVYKPCLVNEDKINLKHDIFNPDAIVMRGLKSKYVDLKCDLNDKKIRFYFSDFEILAVWSLMDERANFVCLEPWNGIQKDFVVDHEKMGVLSIDGKQSKQYSYTIEVIN